MEAIETKSTSAAAPRKGSHRKRIELLSVVLITVGGGVSAWCGFQASLFDGEQSANYNRGGARRVESSRQSALATGQMEVDISLFTAWLAAAADRKPGLEEFYRQRFRPEFARAFEAWFAADPINNPEAPRSPFALRDYQLAATMRAAELQVEASRFGAAGDEADSSSDRYGMLMVVLSLVLVFAGLAPQFRVRGVQMALLAAAVVLLIGSIGALATLPRAWLG